MEWARCADFYGLRAHTRPDFQASPSRTAVFCASLNRAVPRFQNALKKQNTLWLTCSMESTACKQPSGRTLPKEVGNAAPWLESRTCNANLQFDLLDADAFEELLR